MTTALPCPICKSSTHAIGTKTGLRTGRSFALRHCPACDFRFVADPWTDFATIYDDAYYRGEGSDPLVDYAAEYEQPLSTIRRYEWQGVRTVVTDLAGPVDRWLDFGCGNGGLVRYLREAGCSGIHGYDTGSWADRARRDGLPIMTDEELADSEGSFDVISAIEVLEHLTDPLGALRRIHRLLRPGGRLFLTTGNADRAPGDFLSWSYVRPEIHVSYFSVRALSLALQQSGFRPLHPPRSRGWDQIVRFKVLKTLRHRRRNLLERLIPWRWVAPWVDARHGCSALPIGVAVQ